MVGKCAGMEKEACMHFRQYYRPETLDEAMKLAARRSNRIIGGGLWLRQSRRTYGGVIDLSALGLDKMERTDDSFRIGAMVTLRQAETDGELNRMTGGAFSYMLSPVVGVQFRNLATIGGSVWGRFGFSDVLTVLLAMDTDVELYKGGLVPLEQFAAMPYDRDLLVRAVIRKTPGTFAYQAMRVQRTDLPVLTCAFSHIGGEYRAVIGARPGRAMVLRDQEGLLAGGITPDSAHLYVAYGAALLAGSDDHLDGSEPSVPCTCADILDDLDRLKDLPGNPPTMPGRSLSLSR